MFNFKFCTVLLALFMIIGLTGCGNLSPRNEQKIDNQDGKIDEIKNNQNGIMGEIGTLKNQAEIQNSKLEKIQQGMLNLQSNNDNHGVQIFSGSGGLLVAIVGIISACGVVLYFRSVSKMHEKTATMLAERIVNANDPQLEEAVFSAAMYTNVESNVLNLINKAKKV